MEKCYISTPVCCNLRLPSAVTTAVPTSSIYLPTYQSSSYCYKKPQYTSLAATTPPPPRTSSIKPHTPGEAIQRDPYHSPYTPPSRSPSSHPGPRRKRLPSRTNTHHFTPHLQILSSLTTNQYAFGQHILFIKMRKISTSCDGPTILTVPVA